MLAQRLQGPPAPAPNAKVVPTPSPKLAQRLHSFSAGLWGEVGTGFARRRLAQCLQRARPRFFLVCVPARPQKFFLFLLTNNKLCCKLCVLGGPPRREQPADFPPPQGAKMETETTVECCPTCGLKPRKPGKPRGRRGVMLGVPVAQGWIEILSRSQGKTDAEIAEEMRAEYPECKKYHEGDVAKHRTLYNKGKIAGQTEVPETKLTATI